uniref:Uncharacterized protein n=1 Tax=Arundo donax TaxID=35708 RepID=A0A0A9DRJ8_ARUDO
MCVLFYSCTDIFFPFRYYVKKNCRNILHITTTIRLLFSADSDGSFRDRQETVRNCTILQFCKCGTQPARWSMERFLHGSAIDIKPATQSYIFQIKQTAVNSDKGQFINIFFSFLPLSAFDVACYAYNIVSSSLSAMQRQLPTSTASRKCVPQDLPVVPLAQ